MDKGIIMHDIIIVTQAAKGITVAPFQHDL